MTDESSSWLIQRSKECLSTGNQEAADSWIITATSLYPDSFAVQHEVLHAQLKTGQIAQAAQQLANMLERFSSTNELWDDVQSMLATISSDAADSMSETWRLLFEALQSDVQQQILRSCADNCRDDVVSHCQLSVQLMKLFPDTVLEFGVETVRFLSSSSVQQPLCQKILVNEALPLLLSSTHCQTLLSKVPGDEVISWLHMSLFYCSQNCTDSVNGTPVFDFLRTDLMSPMTSPTTPRRSSMASRSRPEDMTRDSWLKLLRLAQSVGLYLRWSIPPELCNSTLHLSDRLAVLKSLPKSHPSFFHMAVILLFESLTKYRIAIHVNSRNDCPLVMLSSVADSGSQSGSDLQALCVLGGTEAGKRMICDSFKCAVMCWEAVHSDKTLKKEFASLQRKWSSVNWELVHSFEVDFWLYRREFSRLVTHLQSDRQTDSSLGTVAQLKLSSCLANTGNLRGACEVAISVLLSVLEELRVSTEGEEVPDIELADVPSTSGVILLPVDASYVVPFCIRIAITHYKSIAFDGDRNDIALSRLMLFCQHDWPSLRQLFLRVMKQVQDNRGLTFENFFRYITNIDMLEEVMWLSSSDTIQLYLLPSSHRQRTVTRGVDKEAKEELRIAFERQALQGEDQFIPALYLFLQDTVTRTT